MRIIKVIDMQNILRYIVVVIHFAIFAMSTYAHDFQIIDNGVTYWYNLIFNGNGNNKSAQITYQGSSYESTNLQQYNGNIIIPSEIYYRTNRYQVISINNHTFWNKRTSSVSIPNTIVEIGSYAFGYSPLKYIKIDNTDPNSISVNVNTFFGINFDECKLIVPCGCKNAYANAQYWSEFKIIEESCDYEVSDIILNTHDLNLLIGESKKIIATVLSDNTADKTIAWASDNEAVATVAEDGTVTAVSVGVAYITATCGNVSATCKVTVNPIIASSVELNIDDLTLLIGQTDRLIATVQPDNTTDKTVTWISDNEAVATVAEDGTVTAVSVGVTYVTATCGNVSATCKVTVNPIPASGVVLNVEDMTLFVGQTDRLTATVEPENTTDATVTWASDNEVVAKVSADGTVTAISVGIANVTATCGDVSATCKVTVNPFTASGIVLNVKDMSLFIGQSDKLTATVEPENVTDATIRWQSDNEAVAKVSADGMVTAVSVGVANITATCGDVSATCKVMVNPIPASGVVLNVEDITIFVGQTDRLTATVEPENTTDATVTWASDNEVVAKVSADGTVTAVSVGVANITAKCGDVSATCKVTVLGRIEMPTQFERKGNGTSCTFVVMMPLSDAILAEEGYRFVYGYTDNTGLARVIANTPLRYCHTSAQVYNDATNDFWVFAYQVSPDNSTVNSGLRFLDGRVDMTFDGTQLINSSRNLHSGLNPDNWITPTTNGAKINIESDLDAVLNVYTVSGLLVRTQVYAGGVTVTDELDSSILTPGLYIVTVKSGSVYNSKKITIK